MTEIAPILLHLKGIDPRRDIDYLWIAENARDAVYEEPLPAPWKKLRPKHSYMKVPDVSSQPMPPCARQSPGA